MHAVEQPECVQNGGVDADAHPGIALFYTLQGCARGEGAMRHDLHCQTAPQTGLANVRAEVSKCPMHG